MGASDQLSDPFAVVAYHHKRRKTTNPGSPTSKQNSEKAAIGASEGDSFPLLQSDHLNQAAANPFVNSRERSYIGRAEVKTDHFNFTLTNEPIDDDSNCLHMPIRMNPHENGLNRSQRFREQK